MSELRVCFFRFVSAYDTRPRTRERRGTPADLTARILELPADGKTHCRAQNDAGQIVELRRQDGLHFELTPLNPPGERRILDESALDDELTRFAAPS